MMEEAESELSSLRESKAECDRLRELNDGLEAETSALKEKLRKIEGEYGEDREKIATALAGFDEEMTNAEAKLRSVLDELEQEKKKVKNLTEAQSGLPNMELPETSDRKAFETELQKVKEECETRVDKYKKDIGVYEEAIKMLQKQVDILEDLSSAPECAKCLEMGKMKASEETRVEQLVAKAKQEAKEEVRDEVREEFIYQINTQQLEHDRVVKEKDANISALQEKYNFRKDNMDQLEQLCSRARQDLSHLMDQKDYLEKSLERSIHYIKDLKQSQQAIASGATDAIELVMASSPGEGFLNELDDICGPIFESTPTITIPKDIKSLKDVGAELDALLASVEVQIGMGLCGSPKNQGLHDMSTKSW